MNKRYEVHNQLTGMLEEAQTFEEAKGRVINDYQQFLEENWVSELQKEFTVKVSDKVFEKLKAKK